MTIDRLDKNSKFGYRRRDWHGTEAYIYYENNRWFYYFENGGSMLARRNLRANDWYLSTIPNKFYKEPEMKETILQIDINTITAEQVAEINKILSQKPKVELWEPKGGRWTVYLDYDSVEEVESENPYRLAGLEYSTEERAEEALKAIRSYARQLAWIDENNDGWVADWSDNTQLKFCVFYSNLDKNYRLTSWGSSDYNVPVMSAENAEKLCALLNDGVVVF